MTNMLNNHNHVINRYDHVKLNIDPQSRRTLILANKMKVFLTSYPTTIQSKVQMEVDIGSMCDPDDIPGLAHFCEHMLFLGTKKYPQQNDFYIYISQNSGNENATTYLDHTTFNFNISSEKLEGALDRFAQFFLAPLFSENLIDLELNIINSEYELYLADDKWRVKQLEKSFANPDHPFSKFGTGNRETLDIIPKQKGINIRNRLIEFYEKYYSANIMSLYIVGKESLDELENMVVKYFSYVQNKKVEVPVWSDHPFNDIHFGTIWYIVPIKDTRDLYASFPLPEMQQHYWNSNVFYVSYLLEYKGEGSLLSALRVRSWCNSLKSYIRTVTKNLSFFDINVDLTEEGIMHINEIVQLIFEYINLLKLKGPIKWIYDQHRKIVIMKMSKPEVDIIIPKAFHTPQKLQKHPINQIFCENADYSWQPELIEQIMEYLTPQNIRIYVIAKAYESIANETERWYGTKYKKEKVSRETMNMWNLGMDLKLPSKNEFIPTTFNYKLQLQYVGDSPIILKDTLFTRLWHKKDEDFIVAETIMIFNFASPLVYMDPLNYNLTELFVQLFCDSLYQYTNAADLAGLEWNLVSSQYGITLTISGYDEKQPMLLEKIIDRLINFKIDPKRFVILKENYIRNLKNFDTEPPDEQAKYYLEVLLSESFWHKNELLKFAVYLSIDRLQQFICELFSKVHMECLIYGNMITEEAINIVELIESKFKTEIFHIPLLERQLILHRGIKLEDGCNFLYEVKNKWYKSFCIMVYFAIGLQSTESNMLLKLLSQIIEGPCYYTLRIEEKLGYLVSSDIHKTNGAQGLGIIVQSDKHPQYVEKRIDSFLDSMLDHISTISQEQFEEHKKAIKVSIKPVFFENYGTLYWNEIESQQYNFDRVNIEVAYLDTITRQQLLNFYEKNIHSKCTRRKLSIHVIPTTMLAEKNLLDEINRNNADWLTHEGIKKINDISSFKNNQALFPLLKPFDESFLKKGLSLDNSELRYS